MKAVFKESPTDPSHIFMRAAGYAKYANREGDESYVRRVTGQEFPRFHTYVQESGDRIMISMHIDQKGHSYDSAHAHSGEYFGTLIEQELARISGALGLRMAIVVGKDGKPVAR
ncbi:MAG: hypothetical protein NT003_04490 [Candidatus Magasanikbacteria bacterium]|nr:hypothetical protein [Candidatus Magasanikbacteria bacterium]